MLVPPHCWSCGEVARRREPLCTRCRLRMRRLAPEPVTLCGVRVWAPVGYSGPARDLVRALKFGGALRVADTMAAQIAANAPRGILDGVVLVPVPLHPPRMRARGYNQAAVIAAALGRRTGLEVAEPLVRSGPAATQVGRHRAERRTGPAGSISVRAESVPARAVLVDDVATTGATLAACAAALSTAGCAQIAAVTFARTLGR
jgi:ComF family protein